MIERLFVWKWNLTYIKLYVPFVTKQRIYKLKP